MGIAFALVAIFGVLIAAATFCAVVLGAGTAVYLRTLGADRWRAVGIAAVFPFGCVLYAAFWFFCYMMLNDALLHHDPILGDGWYTNIGHGYAVDMIDVTDQGWIHPTDGPENGFNHPDAVRGVRRLQLAGTWIFGSQDTNSFNNLGSDRHPEDRFFAVNTEDRTRTAFDSEAQLTSFARSRGVDLKLQPILWVYQEQRSGWFDLLAGVILLLLPAVVFWRLIGYIRRIRMQSEALDGSLPPPV